LRRFPESSAWRIGPRCTASFEALELRNKQRRNALIREAHLRHGYRLAEIAEALDLHYTTVSKVINELK